MSAAHPPSCGTPALLAVVNNGTHFLAEMMHALGETGCDFDLVPGDLALPPEGLDRFDGIILTGGDAHVYDGAHAATVPVDSQVLELATVPVLGICLGHQLIAHHFGGTIEPLPAPIDRHEEIERVGDDILFTGLPKRFRARIAHDDAVVALGGELVTLARSALSDFEAIRHVDRPMWGLQFHPEASGEPGLHVLRNFVAICGTRDEGSENPVVDRALADE